MENKVVTIKDVAKKAGVSVSTVSRAFNNYSDINPETRELILKVADELGYRPNIIARSLSSNKNFRLGMLVEDYDLVGMLNPLVFEILMSFKNTATKLGYETVLLSTTSDIQKNEKLSKLFSDKQLDGMFIMGLKMTDEYYRELSKIDSSCVLYDININNPNVGCVGVDNTRGAFLAVEYLLKNGHKKIGFINGHKDAYVSYERLDGYYLAHNRYAVNVDNTLIEYADFTDKGAEEAVEKLINRHRDLTAIFCASDIMAIGALNRLNDLGYTVPDDISLIGFDGIYLSQCVSPKLTTIKQDTLKIGEAAANLLFNLIQGQRIGRVVIEPELVERESVKTV
ncbi:LacI family DNA-binding transcriptional regulator [Caloramator proteoclasticus]|uniref:Transcriptional regulator, LacI family n=1 Tax=Caloramator proteoclasticus DSM 10124 TaxID=1121262 RepID=A0A1M4TWV5_9CLOT|nr:LacI family DNA-binding transcriptional regulator [Caloramator proteoclasticus]SHE48938.1 transcriptional regulator, LacI family [Caloramator proteoclasticus DSM 10124]